MISLNTILSFVMISEMRFNICLIGVPNFVTSMSHLKESCSLVASIIVTVREIVVDLQMNGQTSLVMSSIQQNIGIKHKQQTLHVLLRFWNITLTN